MPLLRLRWDGSELFMILHVRSRLWFIGSGWHYGKVKCIYICIDIDIDIDCAL